MYKNQNTYFKIILNLSVFHWNNDNNNNNNIRISIFGWGELFFFMGL